MSDMQWIGVDPATGPDKSVWLCFRCGKAGHGPVPATHQCTPDPDDSAALLAAAEQAIRRTLADGQGKYQPGEWKEHKADIHWDHAVDHAREIGADLMLKDTQNAALHIDHAITRLCMAKALLEKP